MTCQGPLSVHQTTDDLIPGFFFRIEMAISYMTKVIGLEKLFIGLKNGNKCFCNRGGGSCLR